MKIVPQILLNTFGELFFAIQRTKKNPRLLDENSEVTVILTSWKRNYLEEQISSLLSQSVLPSHIWLVKYLKHHNIDSILKKYPFINLIDSSVDFKYFGRFALALFVKTKYTWILDDDIIPGRLWLENARHACEEENAIVSCAGRRIPKNTYFLGNRDEIEKHYFGDITKGLNYNYNSVQTIVDFGCNSWFLKSEWMSAFWQVPPSTLEMAEDMHLSVVSLLKLGIKTIVLRQINVEDTGNLRIDYGRDAFASWTKPGFYQIREGVLHYLIDQLKWKPMLWDSD